MGTWVQPSIGVLPRLEGVNIQFFTAASAASSSKGFSAALLDFQRAHMSVGKYLHA